MKKLVFLVSILLLAGCVAGDFGEKREHLYDINSDKEICAKHPERCTSGVSW